MKKTLQIILLLSLIFLIYFFYKTNFGEEKKVTINQETIDKIKRLGVESIKKNLHQI